MKFSTVSLCGYTKKQRKTSQCLVQSNDITNYRAIKGPNALCWHILYL